MAPVAWILLLLLPAAGAVRVRHKRGPSKAWSLEGLHNEYAEPRETWDRFSGSASTRNVTAQWVPCFTGMCWNSWGADSNTPGVGGIGDRGCRWFSCPGSSKFMDCAFGPCPKHFGTSTCVSSSDCRSYCDLQHAGTCTYNGPRSQSSWPSWMSEFQNVPLNKLIMIEAHHVLSRLGTLDFENPVQSSNEILDTLAPLLSVPGLGDLIRVAYASLLPLFSSTQSQSSDAASLLNSGVRAFDIRPYLSITDDQLRDHHGARGAVVEDAFSQIAAFVKEHRSELVFVNLQNVYSGTESCLDCKDGSDTFQKIVEAVQRHFGGCGDGVLLCGVDITKTVGQLATEGNVIVHTNSWGVYQASGEPRKIHWSNDMYTAPWHNKNNLAELKSAMLGDARAQERSRGSTTLIGHQWIMTPGTDDFVGAISQRWTGEFQGRANQYGCQSLACLAEVASGVEFKSFFSQIRQKYARSNFLMLDFADRPGAMEFIMEANRNYAQ